MKKPAFYTRQFLNTEESGGCAFIELKVDEVEWNKDGSANLEVTFKIADCSRVVDLDFFTYTDKTSDASDIDNTRTKLRRLTRAVNGFAKALNAALDEIEQG